MVERVERARPREGAAAAVAARVGINVQAVRCAKGLGLVSSELRLAREITGRSAAKGPQKCQKP